MDTDSPTTSGRNSPALPIEKLCPCKIVKEEKTAWLQCTSPLCDTTWWHGTCVGFYSRQSTLNAITQKWICPYCCISKLPNYNISNDKLFQNISNKIEEMKTDIKEEINAHQQNLNKNILSYAEAVKKNQTSERDETNSEVKSSITDLQKTVVKQLEKVHNNLVTEFGNQKSTISESINSYTAVASKNLEQNVETKKFMTTIQGNLQNLKLNMETKINQEKELKLRGAKELNVCIFNVTESQQAEADDQYKEDIANVKETLKGKLLLKKEDISDFYRKGERKEDLKPRPIIIKLSSLEVRNKLLSLRNLFLTTNNSTVNVFISPDRTWQQQLEHKKLVEEKKILKAQGKNVLIRNNKLVEVTVPFRRKPQSFWGD